MKSIFLSLIAVACLSAAATWAGAIPRSTLSLDGNWAHAVAAPDGSLPKDGRDTVRVPDLRGDLRAHAAEWYARDFTLDRVVPGLVYRLEFEQVNQVAHVYLNGRLAAVHVGGYFPFTVDVTKLLVPGVNRLEVKAENRQALVMKNLRAKADLPPELRSDITKTVSIMDDAMMAPVSSQGAIDRSWGILGHVELAAVPAVHLQNIVVRPWVKSGVLDVQVTVANHAATPYSGTVEGGIVRQGTTAIQLPPKKVELPPGAAQTIHYTNVSAKVLQLWWPITFRPAALGQEPPVLYTAEFALRATAATDGMADALRQTFGYRQLWAEGTRYILNGIPITLFGTSAHFPEGPGEPEAFYDAALSSGANIVRLHMQPRMRDWYEAADRRGILLIGESAIGLQNRGSSNPVFWENARRQLTGFITARRNHPAIVIWSIENEMGLDGHGKFTDAEVRKLYTTALAVDDSRLIEAEGDTDLGVMPMTNIHCWWDYGKARYPECFFWYEKSACFPDYREVGPVYYRKKPLYIGECSTEFWASEDYRGEPACVFGDAAYHPDRIQRFILRGRITGKQMESYRWQGIPGMSPFTIFETGTPVPGPYPDQLRRAFRPIALLMREENGHFFAGDKVSRSLQVLNDTADPQNFRLAWSLTGTGAAPAAQGERTFSLPAGGRQAVTVAFTAPPVSCQAEFAFRVQLWKAGQPVDELARSFTVFNRVAPAITAGAVPVAVYGGDAHTQKLLRDLCPAVTPLARFTAEVPAPGGILIIAPNAAGSLTLEARRQLAGRVRAGGIVLCLEQADALPSDLAVLGPADGHTLNFINHPEHPLWNDGFRLHDDDLRWWAGGVVVERMLRKPSRGDFTILTSGGFDLDKTSLLECREGKGRWIFCQLPLLKQFRQEPVAGELLRRLLRHSIALGQNQVTVPRAKTAGVYSRNPALLAFLADRTCATVNALTPGDLATLDVLLTTGQDLQTVTPAERTVLARFTDRGGTLFIHDLTPAAATALNPLLPAATITPFDKNQVLRNGNSPLTTGLTAADLYWCSDYFNLSGSSKPIGASQISLPCATPLTIPALLVALPRGRGTLYVDQIRWLETGLDKAARIGSTVLNNLGVPMRPDPPRNAVNQSFFLDLNPYLNRTFRDAKAGDGDAGWSDQGENDLRDFPTGWQTFRGIPFAVATNQGGMAVLVSGAERWRGKVPAAIRGIQVNRNVTALYFLQAAAWAAGDQSWQYVVHYADGTQAVIEVRNNVHVVDWWNEPQDLPGALAAWSGKNPKHAVSIYLQPWKNPRPALTVSSLDLINPGPTAAFLLAVTGDEAADVTPPEIK